MTSRRSGWGCCTNWSRKQPRLPRSPTRAFPTPPIDCESCRKRRPGALIVVTGSFMTARRYQLAALAMRHALPAIYAEREQVLAGGLMSYSSSIIEAYHLKGVY